MKPLTYRISDLHAMGTYVCICNILHGDVQNNALSLIRVSHRHIFTEPYILR